MNYLRKWAEFDPRGVYRWVLGRTWSADATAPTMHFVMLNPSKADAVIDDPTIRRCVAYAMREECSGVVVTNLSSFMATEPAELLAWLKKNAGSMGSYTQAGADAAWGAQTDKLIRDCALASKFNVVAWGTNARHKLLHQRAKRVLANLLADAQDGVTALQVSEDGIPNHPLMLPGSLRPVPLHQLKGRGGLRVIDDLLIWFDHWAERFRGVYHRDFREWHDVNGRQHWVEHWPAFEEDP